MGGFDVCVCVCMCVSLVWNATFLRTTFKISFALQKKKMAGAKGRKR